jgi:hypothetical protein
MTMNEHITGHNPAIKYAATLRAIKQEADESDQIAQFHINCKTCGRWSSEDADKTLEQIRRHMFHEDQMMVAYVFLTPLHV